jgi:hypothetical protein
LLGAIRLQLPQAEKALARFYHARFKLSAAQAKRQASYLSDLAYRSHYIFPGTATDKRHAANPWPLR